MIHVVRYTGVRLAYKRAPLKLINNCDKSFLGNPSIMQAFQNEHKGMPKALPFTTERVFDSVVPFKECVGTLKF